MNKLVTIEDLEELLDEGPIGPTGAKTLNLARNKEGGYLVGDQHHHNAVGIGLREALLNYRIKAAPPVGKPE